ncbi:protein kinase RIO2 [Sugiyamaella lignohabitans]|uniref:non-specific serine/threonine protein kinase n=1 Tax=Sugiyamaella lignohabitans TaxID=796027 RepID=A0A167FFW7_9ASCO|nr:protein kinase RIO2 [Sugiyamaella lignohabitans]ANB15248.1 protein kinase RIO2 [Sugiyamaella lignohabitans]
MGSKNHDIVPTSLITQISGLRSPSAVNRCIAELAKIKLIGRVRNAKYDGYRLSYHGYDYLALKALVKRDSVFGVGSQIGIGKESDIFMVADTNGKQNVLKVHRLGRISFRTVKNNRDYLRNRQSASWMYLSRLAAQKEFAFMKALYDSGFSVPVPIDQSRHQIVMSLIDGFPMRQLRSHSNPGRLYSTLMDFIVRLASYGLIHCDFNEFNIMVREKFDKPEEEVVIIDFPQCISISHVDAQRYFERDVDCIRSFFEKKLNYVSDDYPRWDKDVKRVENLDLLVEASGFSKKQVKDLEAAMQLSRETFGEDEFVEGEGNDEDEADEEQNGEDGEERGEEEEEDDDDEKEEEDDDDEEEEEEESEDEVNEEDELQERINAEIARKGIENMKMDKLGNYILDD